MKKFILLAAAVMVCVAAIVSAQNTTYLGRNSADIKSNTLQFAVPSTPGAYTQGQAYFDTTAHTLDVEIGNGVTLNIGMESLYWAYNATGSIIPNGSPVYVSGVYGGHRSIAPAKADAWATAQFFGITTQDFAIGGFGYVNQRGYINGLNTSSYTAGDTLWLSPTVAGAFVTTEPSDPYFAVQCGRVLIKSTTDGRIGFVGRIPERVTDLADANITSPSVDQVLRYNGSYWTNGTVSGGGASAANGIDFFMDDTEITGTGTNNAIEIVTLSKTPVTTTATTKDSCNVTSATSPVIGEAYLYNTALSRSYIDAGVWVFNTYASVNSTLGGRQSYIQRNLFRVMPNGAGATVATTGGPGTTRTATLTGATTFVPADSSVLRQNAGYLQTPQGLYQISAYTSTSVVTIIVPSTYTNETGVTYSIWRKKFGVVTPTITTTSVTAPTISTVTTAQDSIQTATTDKLGEIVLAFSNNTTVVRWYHNGSSYYSNFKTPLVTLHNNLAGLQGGTTDQYYHMTGSWMVDIGEYADTLKTALDSLTVLKLADTVNLPAEYSTYAHVFGNGTATGDSIFFAKVFMPQTSNPDSIYFWIYASSTSADSASMGVTISQKTGTTDTPFNTLVITATTANTWERKVYAFDDFLSGVYTAIIRARVALGYKINFSPIYFK